MQARQTIENNNNKDRDKQSDSFHVIGMSTIQGRRWRRNCHDFDYDGDNHHHDSNHDNYNDHDNHLTVNNH